MGRGTLRAFGNKRDISEAAIVEVLRKAGCSIIRMDKPVDLLVMFRGHVLLVECKTGKRGRLTKSQTDLIEAQWPIWIIRSVDEAIGTISLWNTAGRSAA